MIHETIAALRLELREVQGCIEMLERLQALRGNQPVLPKRRGRKSMGPDERKEVSERMRRYHAAKKMGVTA